MRGDSFHGHGSRFKVIYLRAKIPALDPINSIWYVSLTTLKFPQWDSKLQLRNEFPEKVKK